MPRPVGAHDSAAGAVGWNGEVDREPSGIERESTARSEDLLQLPAASLHTRLHPRNRYALTARRFRLSDAVEIGEFKGPAVVVGKLGKQRTHARSELAQHLRLVVTPYVSVVARDVSTRIGVQILVTPRSTPVLIRDGVAGDPEHPAAEAVTVIHGVEALVDPEQDLTDYVVRAMRIRDPTADEGLNRRTELTPDEFDPRRCIPPRLIRQHPGRHGPFSVGHTDCLSSDELGEGSQAVGRRR